MRDGTAHKTYFDLKEEGNRITGHIRATQFYYTITGSTGGPEGLPLPALHKVPYNGLAKTPPMGWNSWNKFASKVDDKGVRAAAAAIASNSMKEAGYVYVNVDDTWQGERDARRHSSQ